MARELEVAEGSAAGALVRKHKENAPLWAIAITRYRRKVLYTDFPALLQSNIQGSSVQTAPSRLSPATGETEEREISISSQTLLK